MAFLTTNNIASDLLVGYDSEQVDRLLLSAQAELQRIGIVFSDDSASAFSIDVDSTPRSVFNITPTRTITSVVRKTRGTSSATTLTLNTDYIAHDHINISGYTVQIELLNDSILGNDYLEITGRRGIYVDFTATTNYTTKLLRAGIIDWVRSQLNVKSGQGTIQQGITEASTGKSRVKYGDGQSASLSITRISEDKDFQTVLNYFLGV